IGQRFPQATCVVDAGAVRIELAIDGVTYRARAQMEPRGRVVVQLPSTDGFELALSWTDRAELVTGTPTFDDSCLVETNDVSLANMWLDAEARAALLASRYVSGTPQALRTTMPLLRDGAWQHEVRSDEVCAQRADAEDSAERIVDMLAASLALARRPARWARWFAPLAKSLGGEASARVELGGRPVLRVRRGSSDVSIRLLRRLGPGDVGRLRTVISAHRVASSGEVLTLIAEDLPRSAWPPANDHTESTLRIDARARTLLDSARPSTTIVRRHDVEITFDGALADRDRLGAAVELAAYWATDHSHAGPYR
ncbi:MAG TPA: hypothetical protein VMZ53_27810, partial [Kofleriaceae bacterium]|nr:hypothetical protein [Kofleriaceae bacterium]